MPYNGVNRPLGTPEILREIRQKPEIAENLIAICWLRSAKFLLI